MLNSAILAAAVEIAWPGSSVTPIISSPAIVTVVAGVIDAPRAIPSDTEPSGAAIVVESTAPGSTSVKESPPIVIPSAVTTPGISTLDDVESPPSGSPATVTCAAVLVELAVDSAENSIDGALLISPNTLTWVSVTTSDSGPAVAAVTFAFVTNESDALAESALVVAALMDGDSDVSVTESGVSVAAKEVESEPSVVDSASSDDTKMSVAASVISATSPEPSVSLDCIVVAELSAIVDESCADDVLSTASTDEVATAGPGVR